MFLISFLGGDRNHQTMKKYLLALVLAGAVLGQVEAREFPKPENRTEIPGPKPTEITIPSKGGQDKAVAAVTQLLSKFVVTVLEEATNLDEHQTVTEPTQSLDGVSLLEKTPTVFFGDQDSTFRELELTNKVKRNVVVTRQVSNCSAQSASPQLRCYFTPLKNAILVIPKILGGIICKAITTVRNYVSATYTQLFAEPTDNDDYYDRLDYVTDRETNG